MPDEKIIEIKFLEPPHKNRHICIICDEGLDIGKPKCEIKLADGRIAYSHIKCGLNHVKEEYLYSRVER
jgi:hypothetical protein